MSDDLERVGLFVQAAVGSKMPQERRIAEAWPRVVGEEIARNAQPRSLRNGRLVVATSSSVWAQTLQFMAEQVKTGLNQALDGSVVGEVVFRPAGWDPGGGAEGPRPLSTRIPPDRDPVSPPVPGDRTEVAERRPRRRLTDEEEEAIAEVRLLACDDTLGGQIASAMRAYMERQRE